MPNIRSMWFSGILALDASACATAGETAFQLGGIGFGIAEEALAARVAPRLPELSCEPSYKARAERVCTETGDLRPLDGSLQKVDCRSGVEFLFIQDQLMAVILATQTPCYRALLAGLQEKFGEPVKSVTRQVSTAPRYEKLYWQLADGYAVSENFSAWGLPTVVIESQRYAAAFIERQQAMAEEEKQYPDLAHMRRMLQREEYNLPGALYFHAGMREDTRAAIKRAYAALDRHTAQAELARFSRDPWYLVRLAVAYNPSCGKELLRKLSSDSVPEIAAQARLRLDAQP